MKPLHRVRFPLLPAIALSLMAWLPLPAGAALPAAIDGQPMPTLAPMLDRATPAVVNIATVATLRTQVNPLLEDPFFRRFFNIPDQPRQRRTQSVGSGVIIDAEHGYLLTNHHVVDKADSITVTLLDGRHFDAHLIGSDPESDVAVLQIPAENLSALPLADSDQLNVGDFVVAIGNPFGLGQTVTSGIVSALGRSGLGIEGYEDFIQTDASINPGNSGGALVNLRGELIGINTAILAPGGGNVGIGFAIPIRMAQQITAQLLEHGAVQRGQLGISAQDLTPELAQAFGIDAQRGTVISRIDPGSAADKAGLRVGDVILEVDGRPVRNTADVRNRVGMVRVGQDIYMTILRDGTSKSVRAVVAEPELVVIDGGKLHLKLTGAEIAEIRQPKAEFDHQTGLFVTRVEQGSHAWQTGLRPGDRIVSANRVVMDDLETLRKIAGQVSRGRLLLNIQRGNDALFVLLQP